MDAATPSDVLALMRATVAAWHAAQDRRAIFLDCYSRMTANMLRAIAAGTFADGARAHALLTRFSGFYFDALAAWEHDPGVAPAPWRLAFDAARNPSSWVTRDLLMGVNAHINHDLAFAVEDTIADRWAAMNGGQRQSAYEDFTRVNDIIAATIDEVQDEVLEPFNPLLNVIDVAMGPLDEWLISRLVGQWRQRVWEHAVVLLEARDATARVLARGSIVAASVRIGEAILGHSGPLGALQFIEGL